MPSKSHFFLSQNIRREVKELFAAIWIQNFAVMLITLFVPIYLYELGYEVWKIALFFFIHYFVYLFTIPFGAKIAGIIGYEHAIALSMPVMVIYHLALFGIEFYDIMFYVAAILFSLAKSLYWPSYHADLARFGGKAQRGRELSIMFVVGQLTIFAAPLIAGSILEELSFGWLFVLGSVLLLISVIPLLMTKEDVYNHTVKYGDYFRAFFAKKHRRRLMTYLGLGEELVGMTIWPLLIFVVVGNFFIFGGVITAAMAISGFFLLLTGRLTDKYKKEKVARAMGFLYFLSWFPRMFVQVPLQAFAADSFSQFSKTATMIPLTSITYEEAKENYKDHVMLGAVLFELGYIWGKTIAAAVLVLAAYYIDDLRVLLLIGALFSLFYLLIKEMRAGKKA